MLYILLPVLYCWVASLFSCLLNECLCVWDYLFLFVVSWAGGSFVLWFRESFDLILSRETERSKEVDPISLLLTLTLFHSYHLFLSCPDIFFLMELIKTANTEGVENLKWVTKHPPTLKASRVTQEQSWSCFSFSLKSLIAFTLLPTSLFHFSLKSNE